MKTLTKIRIVLLAFIVLLILSGLTAFPVRTEISFLTRHINSFPVFFQNWIRELNATISSTPEVMLYGTDWLGFAHIVISLFFIPVFIDPIKYKVNIIIGITACIGVFPLAFICGPLRNIPFFHQLIDCSFGIIGGIFLYIIYRSALKLEKQKYNEHIIN